MTDIATAQAAPVTERKPPEGKGYDLQNDYLAGIEPFWFRWADQWWELPHIKMLDIDVQLEVLGFQGKVAELSDDDTAQARAVVDELFAKLMGAEQAAEFEKTVRPINFIFDMLTKWREHSKTAEEQQGESSASAPSSGSTGRPSKRTSKPSTASASPARSTPRARKSVTRRASS